MRNVKETGSGDFSNEHRKYMLGICGFVSILACVYAAIMMFYGAYGALLLNGIATAMIMACTFLLFWVRKIKIAEIMMSLGGSIVLGVYCYKSPESANPSALLILSAMQAPLYLAHVSIIWNFIGIITPIAIFITLQQPGTHNPGVSPLDVETQALINAVMVSSCALFIGMAGVLGMRRFVAFRDKQREREAQMIQTSKLASLGEMAAGIAHEINNPLAIIEGYAWKLHMSLNNKSNIDRDEISNSINVVIDSTKRITAIINGMRKFSRDGGSDPYISARLGVLIDEAVVLCNARIRKYNATLTITPSALLDADIVTVPVQIVQVLVNLIQNAADATAEIIDESLRSVVVTFSEVNENTISIKVIDSGKGIPREIAQKIFEPFFTTKEAGHGTGLGLSISKSIIENLGGTLSVGLLQGKTCFTVTVLRDASKAAVQIG